jgi:ER lumen protein retaining receptor
MNIFRLAGDMTHLLSIVLLLLKINGTKSCRGEGRRESVQARWAREQI